MNPQDVRIDLLEPSPRQAQVATKGDATFFTVRAGEQVVHNGAWTYAEPLAAAPAELKGLIAFYFFRMSRWLEEGQEIHTHPRDPYARVDVLASDRRVTVSLGGFGSVPGALVAGLLIGVIESLSAYWIGAVYKDIVVYSLFLCFLWFRPQGLMGKS